ncbi:lantibiotic dehydratase [Catenulispora pinisilvae]|uniref:lantibiotic dehydratase n=1 Tax=Catenulispora pinisilvae TaxID=2705253 RepID=UPI0018915EAD|nr:lantibiotic dehydratase [Catenulispora pinisilvae]
MGTKLRLSEVVFLRLSAGRPEWLSELRWPEEVLVLMEDRRRLAADEADAEWTLGVHASAFSPQDWASLRTWMKRAIARTSAGGTPRLLLSDDAAHRAFRNLIDASRRRAALDARLHETIHACEQELQQTAFQRIDDPQVQLIIANASSDFTATISKSAYGDLLQKDRRRLARTLWALLARSVYKSCPLAFVADTGVLLLHGGDETRLRVGATPYLTALPNQELANELIRKLRPLDRYLVDGKRRLHLNVSAILDGQQLRIWRSRLEGSYVHESLARIRLPQAAVEVLASILDPDSRHSDAVAGPAADVVRKLVAEQILMREDLVTPADGDPWTTLAEAVADAASESITDLTIQVGETERFWRSYAYPRPITDSAVGTVATALSAVRRLSTATIGPDKIASASVSVDTYRRVQGDISSDDLAGVRQAVEQYFALGALVYPMTPTYRKRHAFIDFFRAKYGEDRPVSLESMLVDDWTVVDRTLSFLLDPGDSPIHPDSDLVWPEPSFDDAVYSAFYNSLLEAAASGRASFDIEPVDIDDIAVLGQCQSVMDAVCRLGRSDDGHLDVFVESATFSGRLVARHLRAVSGLGPDARAAAERYCLDGREPGSSTSVVSAGILASHAVPRLQNLSRVAVDGRPMLALSEPAPAMPAEMLIRYGELSVRLDSARQRLVITRGHEGPEVVFSWSSPLSPSFSRRLHFLRFLALAAEPVITAPRWLASEALRGGRMPRTSVGRLVLSPQRWAIPIETFSPCRNATGARRHVALHSIRSDAGLPTEVFVYTAGDTRPTFVDFDTPFGTDVFLRLVDQAVRRGSSTMLVEERFPQPGREVVDSPSGVASAVFQCLISSDSKGRSC